jgi:lipopolysaccharide transport system ATP-binding protein
MSEVAIKVEGLGKQYKIGKAKARYGSFRESITETLTSPFKRFRPNGNGHSRSNESIHQSSIITHSAPDSRLPTPDSDLIWALKEVSFEVKRGEVVGVIGRNGAGKSTLLKILSRITEPTTGAVDIYGRVGSLLEVGTGFHPELTGRDNIYLNGSIIGMKRAEIRAKFDEIVAFAEIEKFIDTPVKHYSSGMYVRLAFAVAAHLEPEILLVDEVLAVGDAEFQKKCLGKMGDVAKEGRTVLLVSHNMHSITRLCQRGIFLERGCLDYLGDIADTVASYHSRLAQTVDTPSHARRRIGSGEYRFTLAQPTKDLFSPEDEKIVRFSVERHRPHHVPISFSALVFDSDNLILAQCDSRLVGVQAESLSRLDGEFILKTPWLRPGEYRISLYLCSVTGGIIDAFERACIVRVSPIFPYPYSASPTAYAQGAVCPDFGWHISNAFPADQVKLSI